MGAILERMGDETGVIDKEAPEAVALVYPSPYRVAMSSLGAALAPRTPTTSSVALPLPPSGTRSPAAITRTPLLKCSVPSSGSTACCDTPCAYSAISAMPTMATAEPPHLES